MILISRTKRMIPNAISATPGVVHRERVERVEGEDDGDDAHHAGEDGAGVVEFEQQTVDPQEEEDVRDVRIAQDVQDPVLPVHLLLDDAGAPACCRTCVPPSTSTVRPSIESSSAGTDAAIRSMTLSRSASVSVMEMLFRTASSAQRTFRFRFSLIDLMNAAASLVAFSFAMESVMPPCVPTGCAAPMLVPGAIAAMLAASVMKAPAEADWAPEGAT